MKLLILLFASLSAIAQVTISGISANSITDRSARINMTLSASARVYAQFGETTSYGTRSQSVQGDSDNAVLDITGLAPLTTMNYRICQTGFTPPTGCTANQTLTTLTPQSPDPIAPTAVDVSYPSSFTTTYTSTNCTDFATNLATAVTQNGNNNYLITIPAGTVCPGLVLLPAKTGSNPNGTGTIVIASAGTLPPAGARVTTDYESNMVTFLQNTITDQNGTSYPATCTSVDYYYRTDLVGYGVCSATNTWTAVSATAGYTTSASAPTGACVAGYYHWRTGVGNAGLYRCHTSGVWINLLPGGDGRYIIAVPDRYSSATVTGYRLVGLKFENADENYKSNFPYIIIEGGASRITIDRSICKTQSGATANNCVYFNGTNIAIINSHIDQKAPGSSGQTLNVAEGPGPFYIVNNYIRGCGIILFVNDNGATVPRADFTVNSNTFSMKDECNPVSPSYDGLGNRDTRSLIEAKRGTRFSVVGNIFDNYYTYALSGGVALLFTPRANNSTGGDDNSYQISDLNINSNTFKNGTGGIEIWGNDDQGYRGTKPTTRINISDNLAYLINGANSANGAVRGHWLYIQDGIEHLAVKNNTLVDMQGTGPAFMYLTGVIGGLNVVDNIWWLNHGAAGDADVGGGIRWNDPSGVFSTLCDGTTISGSSAKTKLDKCAVAGTVTNYTFLRNVIVGGTVGDTATYTPAYPSGNLWPGDTTTGATAIGFIDSTTYNYRLKYSSTYAPYGSGANLDSIRAAQGEIYNLRALSITSSGATLAYTTPDSTSACTIEYGTSSTPGTGSRVTDTTGSRFRTKALTGLTTNTVYYYRIYCSQMSSSSFTTI